MIERDRCRDTPRCWQGRELDCLIGTRHADFIRASGQTHGANRPDTDLLPGLSSVRS